MMDEVELFGDDQPNYDDDVPPTETHGADWHMRWWKRLNRQRAELAAEFDQAIAQIQSRKEDRLAPIEKKMAWHAVGLERFARANYARTKQATHHLPSGGATQIRKSPARLKYDDEDLLLAWLEINLPEAVKVVETRKIDQRALKAAVQWHELEPGSMTEAVTNNGEVVPGLTVVFPERTFSIKEDDE